MHVNMQHGKHRRGGSAAPILDRDFVYRTVKDAWQRRLFTQEEVARHLKVNQGQISKILNGHFVRPTGHALRLFEYANSLSVDQPAPDAELQAMKARLIDKLMSAWDQSTQGARALEDLLDVARDLAATGRNGRR